MSLEILRDSIEGLKAAGANYVNGCRGLFRTNRNRPVALLLQGLSYELITRQPLDAEDQAVVDVCSQVDAVLGKDLKDRLQFITYIAQVCQGINGNYSGHLLPNIVKALDQARNYSGGYFLCTFSNNKNKSEVVNRLLSQKINVKFRAMIDAKQVQNQFLEDLKQIQNSLGC